MDIEFEKQRKETFWVFKDIASKHPIPDLGVVEFQMIPTGDASDWSQFEADAQAQGFSTERVEDEDDSTLQITTTPFAISAEGIWEREKQLTEIARKHGFKPDGWGFWGVSPEEAVTPDEVSTGV